MSEGQGDALPCLNSNISNETTDSALKKACNLSTQHRKSAYILQQSIKALSDAYGVHQLGFLTLTFAQHILCAKEAQRRLNSLLTGVIKKRYQEYVGVMERQKSGRIHYHLLLVTDKDLKTGVNFKELSDGNYRSAPVDLRSEWLFWRTTAKKYGFGRTELLPVKSDIEAMAKYLGKYISKHIEARKDDDKGVRLVRYSKGARAGTTRFQFQSEGSQEWRRKLRTFASIVEARQEGEPVDSIADLTRILGPRWAYHHRDFILSLP